MRATRLSDAACVSTSSCASNARYSYLPPANVSPRVLDEVDRAEGVAQGVLEGHARARDGDVGVVVPGEGVPVRDREDGQLAADERVLDRGREVVLRVAPHAGDRAEGLQDGEEEALPVGGEDDELDAEELRHGPEGLEGRVPCTPKTWPARTG